MKKSTTLFIAFFMSVFSQFANASCDIYYHHYGEEAVNSRIGNLLPGHVPDSFCKHLKSYEFVFITSATNTYDIALGTSLVGLRKRGTTSIPKLRMQSFRYQTGNHSIDYAYDLAAKASIMAVDEMMANNSKFINSLKD